MKIKMTISERFRIYKQGVRREIVQQDQNPRGTQKIASQDKIDTHEKLTTYDLIISGRIFSIIKFTLNQSLHIIPAEEKVTPQRSLLKMFRKKMEQADDSNEKNSLPC